MTERYSLCIHAFIMIMLPAPAVIYLPPPPPASVLQDDTSQDAPAEQPEEAAERVVVHEALSQLQ